MTAIKLLAICLLTMIACKQTDQSMEQDSLILEEEKLTQEVDKSSLTKKFIGQMIEPTYSDATNFNQLFDCYIFSFDGETEKVDGSDAIALYHQILDASPEDLKRAPVFETKDAKKVILLTKEKGIQASILIDKTDRSILNLQFHPESETSDLGAKEKALQEQFIGSAVNFSENNFGLKPWDKEKGPGDIQIDGVSGATDICQAAVEMLNSQLKLYQNYFEK